VTEGNRGMGIMAEGEMRSGGMFVAWGGMSPRGTLGMG
jgi:hypothetical protein